jgi:hypothetical protein
MFVKKTLTLDEITNGEKCVAIADNVCTMCNVIKII